MHYTVTLFSLLGCWNQHRLPQCTLSEHFACCCWFTCPLCVLLLLSLSRQCWLHADGARWFICLLSKHVQICATCVIMFFFNVKLIHYGINKIVFCFSLRSTADRPQPHTYVCQQTLQLFFSCPRSLDYSHHLNRPTKRKADGSIQYVLSWTSLGSSANVLKGLDSPNGTECIYIDLFF